MPYIGAFGIVDSAGSLGWGFEAGLHYLTFYTGFEYGVFTYPNPSIYTYGGNNSIVVPYPGASERFWGIHGGYVIASSIYLGIVLVKSYQMWERSDSGAGWITFTKGFLNIGPDLRYDGLDDGHVYLACAYTIRRGFKAGLGYMF